MYCRERMDEKMGCAASKAKQHGLGMTGRRMLLWHSSSQLASLCAFI